MKKNTVKSQDQNPSRIMENFRLIAIRPLEGCDVKYRKVLQEGQDYVFYNEYELIREHPNDIHSEIVDIRFTPNVPQDFYDVDGINGKINVNVSAVVGKNGSGKSSLIDLMIAAIYLLSFDCNILEKNNASIEEYLDSSEKSKTTRSSGIAEATLSLIEKLKPLHSDRDKQVAQEKIQVLIDAYFNERQKLAKSFAHIEKEILYLHQLKKAIQALKKAIKVEVYFQLNEEYFKLKVQPDFGSKCCKLYPLPSRKDGTPNEIAWQENIGTQFFYTILLNYSSYALNSKDLGIWITELFKKNDAYQTPIVMNPMRDEGKFDINKENYLVHSRLLSILLTPVHPIVDGGILEAQRINPRYLTTDKLARGLRIDLDPEKTTSEERFDQEAWDHFNLHFPDSWKQVANRQETEWDVHARRYIINKLKAIARNYAPYWQYDGEGLFARTSAYFKDIESDSSHITYKIKQAIHFLKFDYAKGYCQAIGGKTLDDLVEAISIATKGQNLSPITLVPPPFLKAEVLFSDDIERNTLSDLSSGEKQRVYSMSSMIYHLRFLDSVMPREGMPHKYQFVNFIFDEIELYFHPEFQRTYIQDFRTAVQRAQLGSIKSINCIFITHSPFILSDIPSQNVLMLKVEEQLVERETIATTEKVAIPSWPFSNTLGANIHSLLADSMFLESSIGAFAEEKVQDILNFISWFENGANSKATPKIKDRPTAQQYIALLGEPLIKNELERMLDRQRIGDLERRVSRLESDRSAKGGDDANL